LQQKSVYIAKTLFGLEQVLAQELNDLGASNVVPLHRAVRFEGDRLMLYRANLCLRTAMRILVPLAQFPARNEAELYDGVRAINWQEYLNTGSTFLINSVAGQQEALSNSHYVSLRAKDAIADQFSERFGKRPSVSKEDPDLYIDLHVYNGQCSLSLDSSGEPLSKRGYRPDADRSPFNEVLAAGIVLMSKWDGKSDFVDFMCGTGTLAIEAIMFARNIAPSKARESYAFMKWPDFDMMVWRMVQDEATKAERPYKFKALASDVSEEAIEQAQKSAVRAGLENDLQVVRQDFRRVRPGKGPGLLLLDPPYHANSAEEEEDLEELYWAIGDHLKDYFPDYHAWIISSQTQALRKIEMLRPTQKFRMMHGAAECELVHYHIYSPK
jgi:putative N6-adenine-specific DNA methylase